jgi:hypothetical protein
MLELCYITVLPWDCKKCCKPDAIPLCCIDRVVPVEAVEVYFLDFRDEDYIPLLVPMGISAGPCRNMITWLPGAGVTEVHLMTGTLTGALALPAVSSARTVK